MIKRQYDDLRSQSVEVASKLAAYDRQLSELNDAWRTATATEQRAASVASAEAKREDTAIHDANQIAWEKAKAAETAALKAAEVEAAKTPEQLQEEANLAQLRAETEAMAAKRASEAAAQPPNESQGGMSTYAKVVWGLLAFCIVGLWWQKRR